MTVDIGQSLSEGTGRTFERNGLILVAAWVLLGSASLLASNSLIAGLFDILFADMSAESPEFGPALDISPLIALIALLCLSLVSLVFSAGALRTFVTNETETLPQQYFTRNLGWMLLNLVVGGLVFYIALTIGFTLLFFPGLFLLVCLYFWYVLVVVEDQNFVEAFSNSWALTKGNRLHLFALGAIVVVLFYIASAVPAMIPGWIGFGLSGIVTAVVGVFNLATAARTYVQLADDTPSTTA
ncbi:hypothetical protein [Halovivax cerinus]|uniref:DUF7847 domain-containing protein n=1 Tax=Halovivax cerinus TaxID=1487865 RepID=A0ABD5NJW4_9EURY|nr:hypothetical protein [Halovivax cerinus]